MNIYAVLSEEITNEDIGIGGSKELLYEALSTHDI